MSARPDPEDLDRTDIDDVDAELDAGAPGQDSAVAEYLEEQPENHRIDEIADRGSLGIDAELPREVPDPSPEPGEERPPVTRRGELARLLRAEEFADRVRGQE